MLIVPPQIKVFAWLAPTDMRKSFHGLTGIVEKAKVVSEARDLVQARAAFRPLTDEIEPLTVTEKNVTVMYCPMAKGTWVQDTGPVENPYYGKSMLRCGGPKTAAK